MSQKWLVVFGSEGYEMLVPCDEVMTRDALNWFAGEEGKDGEMGTLLAIAQWKARSNAGRRPEIWVYDTEQDLSEERMRSMWAEAPQGMADLVRLKGTLLFKEPHGKVVIQ
jgi:hypothetical protein